MIKPMLAFRFQDKRKHLTFPCHVQPKLNGIRMLANKSVLMSRSHGKEEPKTWNEKRLQSIRKELESLPTDVLYDGELYVHGWSLQKINSAAAVNRLEDTPQTEDLTYYIFDCVNHRELDAPFSERSDFLKWIFDQAPKLQHIRFVETKVAMNLVEAELMFQDFKCHQYEGAIYRQSNKPYGFAEFCGNKENRWPYLLKRKDWLDDEFEIVDFTLTEGSKGERGFQMFCVTTAGAYFKVGSGLSDMELDEFVDNPPIGKLAKVKFEMYSDGGKPLKPSIISIEEP